VESSDCPMNVIRALTLNQSSTRDPYHPRLLRLASTGGHCVYCFLIRPSFRQSRLNIQGKHSVTGGSRSSSGLAQRKSGNSTQKCVCEICTLHTFRCPSVVPSSSIVDFLLGP